MAAGNHRREPAFVLLLSGAVALLLTDAFYGVKLLGGGFAIDGMPGTGWAVYLHAARHAPRCTPRCAGSQSLARRAPGASRAHAWRCWPARA